MNIAKFISLIPAGIANADKIIQGHLNNIKLEKGILPDDEVEEILRRRLICEACPFNSINAQTSKEYFEVFNKPYVAEGDWHCSICSCPLKVKTASLAASCGIQANKKTENFELKWSKYEKQ